MSDKPEKPPMGPSPFEIPPGLEEISCRNCKHVQVAHTTEVRGKDLDDFVHEPTQKYYCYRYPKSIPVDGTHRCGEWISKKTNQTYLEINIVQEGTLQEM